MRRLSLPLLLAFPLLAAAQATQQTAPPPAYVIHAAHLIDGRSDVVQSDVAIIVQGDRIVAVGRSADVAARIPAGAQTIDLGGATRSEERRVGKEC